MPAIEATASGVLVRLRVQPRASSERLDGVQGEQLRVRLTAPPVNGAANAACLALLATRLGIRRDRLQIRAGAKSRNKLVHVVGMTPEEVATALGISVS